MLPVVVVKSNHCFQCHKNTISHPYFNAVRLAVIPVLSITLGDIVVSPMLFTCYELLQILPTRAYEHKEAAKVIKRVKLAKVNIMTGNALRR